MFGVMYQGVLQLQKMIRRHLKKKRHFLELCCVADLQVPQIIIPLFQETLNILLKASRAQHLSNLSLTHNFFGGNVERLQSSVGKDVL